MISAINNTIPQTSFTSTIPVKVKIDGRETFNEKYIKSACRQLSTILIGPTSEKETNKMDIIKLFGKYDPDYNLYYGKIGYPAKFNQKKAIPSDYFRYVFDNVGHYLMSGLQAESLKNIGKSVGAEKQGCKMREVSDSFDLYVARDNYWQTISYFIKNKKLRITEHYNKETGTKSGQPLTLIINMKSNGKYNKSSFKINIENIEFEKQLNNQ